MTRSHEDTDLRDRIATAVLSALIIEEAILQAGQRPDDAPRSSDRELAEEAYAFADVMLAERKIE